MRGIRFWGIALAVITAAALIAVSAGGSRGPAGPATAQAASTTQQIHMKVLLITDTTGESGYTDWESTLQREGVPYDTVVTNPTGSTSAGSVALPTLSTTASDGTAVANYEGVIVASSGPENMSDAQWSQLQTFEHDFSVRQVTAYVYPSTDYGLNSPTLSGPLFPNSTGMPTESTYTPLTLTADGQKDFPYLKGVALDAGICTDSSNGNTAACQYGYEATVASGANVDTLISGPSDSTMLGIYTSSDGRQTMFQTFDQNRYETQSELLRHGELDWLTRDTYFGDQRNYLETDVDDNFLADDTWSIAGNATTAAHSTDFTAADALRESSNDNGINDIATAAQWSQANHFRIDMLFNGGGSVQYAAGCTEASSGDSGSGGTATDCSASGPGTDPLLSAFQATDPATKKSYTDDFYWINHTWDHPNLDQGCATTNYIEAEINENTNWGDRPASAGDPNSGGLGLTASTTAGDALGYENPNVVITGEHSGVANLLPGNPGQVDPPAFDDPTTDATGGTLGADGSTQYVYAIADQFNTALPGAAPVPAAPTAPNTTEESAASVTPVALPDATGTTTPTTTGAVTLNWGAVCKAADYIIYRAPYTGTYPSGSVGPWSVIADVPASSVADGDFADPTSSTEVGNGGAKTFSYTDKGAGAITTPQWASATPLTEGDADESAYEQNPNLDAAFAGTLDGGIKEFGTDASKPYPNPADASFDTGAAPASQFAAGSTFPDSGGSAVPRYPTNIYYNVASNAQEIDEYETLYDQGGTGVCVPVANVTTCNPAGTTFTMPQIIASVDQGMFQHLMGNDPRPDYFHQTNLMNVNSGSAPDPSVPNANALFYQTIQPLLDEYNQYFASNAPIEQDTMAQIGTLLTEQSAWANAQGEVSGVIEGNKVTVDNTGTGAIDTPLTGTNVGTAYAGTTSGWVSAPVGTSTYTANTAWPALPSTPVVVTSPPGPAPGTGAVKMPSGSEPPTTTTGPAKTVVPKKVTKQAPIYYHAIQVAPKTVKIKKGKVTVSLKCVASRGKTAKGRVCKGSFALAVAGRKRHHTFKIKSTKVDRIAVTLPKVAQAAARRSRTHRMTGTLTIATAQAHAKARVAHGKLTIKR